MLVVPLLFKCIILFKPQGNLVNHNCFLVYKFAGYYVLDIVGFVEMATLESDTILPIRASVKSSSVKKTEF